VREAWSEVVLDLVVQATDEPAESMSEDGKRGRTSAVVRNWCTAKSSPRRAAVSSGIAVTSTQWASWKIIARTNPTNQEQAR
jgi:hypothetical protein